MKKVLILFSVLIFAPLVSQAQGFKFGLHAGGLQAEEGGLGLGLALEPGFQLGEHISVQLRGELVSFTRELNTDQELVDVEVDASAIASYTASIHLYLLGGPVKPFVGAGVGYYVPGKFKVETVTDVLTATAETRTSETIAPDPAFGFYPRVGLEIGHFVFVLDYNIVDDSKADYTTVRVTDVNGNKTVTQEEVETNFVNSYFSFKIGFYLGGGLK